jgi:hypothetical protein
MTNGARVNQPRKPGPIPAERKDMDGQVKGIESLAASVQHDCKEGENCFRPEGCDKGKQSTRCFHRYCDKFKWVLDRAQVYAEAMGVTQGEILTAWESGRNYWYMNYYQESNQPTIDGDLRVFETVGDLLGSIDKEKGFRCPKCGGASIDPYSCTCDGCDWKAYGLFGTLGKGVNVYVKSDLKMNHIFMPLSWETGT